MRIDKYLKVSRIIKRRAVAKELGDNDRLKVNGKLAKPSTEIEVGDIIEITFGHRQLTVREYIKHQAKNDHHQKQSAHGKSHQVGFCHRASIRFNVLYVTDC